MNAVAIQRKENDKSAKATATVTPVPQMEPAQAVATIGVPLFLNGGRSAAATPPPGSGAIYNVQRRLDTKLLEPEDEFVPRKPGNEDVQRQPLEEEEKEEEEEAIQPKITIDQHNDEYEDTEENVAPNNEQGEISAQREEGEPGESETQEPSDTESQQAETPQQETAEEETQATTAEQAVASQDAAEPTEVAASTEQGAQAGEVESFASGAEAQPGEAEPAPASDRPGGDNAVAAETMARISAAPDSLFKSHVAVQADLINTDSLVTEILLTELAEQHRQQVSLQFAAVRTGMVGFVEGHIALAQGVIAAKQEEVIAATTNAFAMAQATVAATMAAIEAQGARIAAVISGIVESAAATVQATVSGIAGQITGLINAIPLPDLPGVAQARRAAASMVNNAAGMVSNSLGLVLNMIRRTLSGGMSLLTSFLQIFARMIDRTFALMSRAVSRIVQTVTRTLNRILSLIVSTLRRVLYGVIIPILVRVENSVIHAITEQEQQALLDVSTNRREHLGALAASLVPGSGTEEGSAAAATTSVDDWITSVMEIGRSARDGNRMILLSFLEQTSGFVALFITTLHSVISLIIQAIIVRVAQMITTLIEMVARFLQQITQMMEAVISFLQSLVARFIETLARIVEFVRSAVQRPIDWLIDHAGRTLTRIRDAVNRFIGRLFGRGATPAEMPLPAPPMPAPPIPAPPIPAPPIPAPPVPVPAPPVPSPTPAPAPPVVVIVIIVLIILLILLYLLYKWLKRKLPKPPKPKPKPCGITTRTVLSAPDGSANTRRVVGVGEDVEMTCSEAVVWAASAGTVVSTSPTTAMWSAPAILTTADVTATSTSGSTCAVAMTVTPPASISMRNVGSHPVGPGGACMLTEVTFPPLNVCLGAIQTLEVPGPATDVQGFFTKYSAADLYHHPNPHYALVNNSNMKHAGPNNGPHDHCAWHTTAGPYSDGRFTWEVPNRYILDGESAGSGRFFTTTHQRFTMDTAGKMTITKAGAST